MKYLKFIFYMIVTTILLPSFMGLSYALVTDVFRTNDHKKLRIYYLYEEISLNDDDTINRDIYIRTTDKTKNKLYQQNPNKYCLVSIQKRPLAFTTLQTNNCKEYDKNGNCKICQH